MKEFRALLNRIAAEEDEGHVSEYGDLSEALRRDIQQVLIPLIIHDGLDNVKFHLEFAA